MAQHETRRGRGDEVESDARRAAFGEISEAFAAAYAERFGNMVERDDGRGTMEKRVRGRRKAPPMVSDRGDGGESLCVFEARNEERSSSSSSDSSGGRSSSEYREWKRRKFLEAIWMSSREEMLRMHVNEDVLFVV